MDINAAFVSLQAIQSVASALIGERDQVKLQAARIELQEKILQAQAQLGQLAGTLMEKQDLVQQLKERITQLETAQNERARYALVEVAPGRLAYRLRAATELSDRADEPAHYVCQPCFDAGSKIVMQLSSNGRLLSCPANPGNLHNLRIKDEPAPSASLVRRVSPWSA